MCCKNHDYVYYSEPWQDTSTGIFYQKGYYDEDGKYYDGDSIAFKKPDGSYEAHYKCDFCGTELESNWQAGFYPTCKNCGAEMNKTPVYIDEIVDIRKASETGKSSGLIRKILGIYFASFLLIPIIFIVFTTVAFTTIQRAASEGTEQIEVTEESMQYETETNLEIYGADIYLDEVSHNTYRICSEQDEYEKHITWDYGAESYYDYETDCYLWYNTDVSPNLWQYWYDDIAGSNYYGWMECEGDDWYIEVSDTDWELYDGDTSQLWHIEK